MICYLANATEVEIAVINAYWLVSDRSSTEFAYTLQEIDGHYKSKKVRPVSSLVKKSSFLALHPAFICHDCNRKTPVKNRTEYISRIKKEGAVICSECHSLRHQRLIDDCYQILGKYKSEILKPVPYLERLTIEESLWLLSITAEQSENRKFLGESPADISVTGVQSIDQRVLLSLIDKQALVYISELPLDVERANAALYGEFERIRYDNRYQKSASYRHPEMIATGVYLKPVDLAGTTEASDISSVIYQRLHESVLSVDDAAQVSQLIKETQIDKLYKLTMMISKEYEIPIDNSNVLRALLNHLADNYPPHKIFFTFNVKARDAVVRMHKDRLPGYIAKHYFAKFVGSYIQYIENRGFELKRTWTLPPQIQTSSFEALFSQVYLNGHFDWNMLSAKEVVALWLTNVRLSEEAQELLIE